MTEARQHIGAKLTELRLSKDLTKYRLSQLTSLTEKQIAGIERGNVNYTVDSLISYLSIFNVSLKFLDRDNNKETTLLTCKY